MCALVLVLVFVCGKRQSLRRWRSLIVVVDLWWQQSFSTFLLKGKINDSYMNQFNAHTHTEFYLDIYYLNLMVMAFEESLLLCVCVCVFIEKSKTIPSSSSLLCQFYMVIVVYPLFVCLFQEIFFSTENREKNDEK